MAQRTKVSVCISLEFSVVPDFHKISVLLSWFFPPHLNTYQKMQWYRYNYTNFFPMMTLRFATVGTYVISENPVSSSISSISEIE